MPERVANADYEELTMTALGAGSTLSTLHSLERAVLVLHGHKHHPSARHLRGLLAHQGDVLVVADGSAGRAEPWKVTKQHQNDPPWPLWPSFNILDFDGHKLRVETCSYPNNERSEATVRRLLIEANRVDKRWEVNPVQLEQAIRAADEQAKLGQFHLASNTAVFELKNASPAEPLWDAKVTRTMVSSGPVDDNHRTSREYIDGATKSIVELHESQETFDCPAGIDIPISDTPHVFEYTLRRALCGTYDQAVRSYHDERTSPYDWVDLFNRFACDNATLVLRGYPKNMRHPFGAFIDMMTGIERPAPLKKIGDDYELIVSDCRARTMLRIFWPLAR